MPRGLYFLIEPKLIIGLVFSHLMILFPETKWKTLITNNTCRDHALLPYNYTELAEMQEAEIGKSIE